MPRTYAEICEMVWSLHQSQREKLIRNQPRNVLFPPPPRGRAVDLLFVGISPNHSAPIRFGRDRQSVEDFARRFRYVSKAGNDEAGTHYDPYYGELLAFARRIDPRFAVWKQIENDGNSLLVDFTDCLHIATNPGDRDDIRRIFGRHTATCPVWQQCKEILEAELLLYQPRIVIGNGRTPSDMLWEVCAGERPAGPPQESVLLNTRFGCNVHLSGFITGKQMDGYSRARLVREIRAQTAFLEHA